MLYAPSHSKFEIPHTHSTSLGSSWLIWMSKIMTWLLAKQETKENISVLFWGSAKFKFNFSQDFVKISINLFNKILKFYWIQQFLSKTFSSWRSCLDIGWFSWHVLSTVHVLPSLHTLHKIWNWEQWSFVTCIFGEYFGNRIPNCCEVYIFRISPILPDTTRSISYVERVWSARMYSTCFD